MRWSSPRTTSVTCISASSMALQKKNAGVPSGAADNEIADVGAVKHLRPAHLVVEADLARRGHAEPQCRRLAAAGTAAVHRPVTARGTCRNNAVANGWQWRPCARWQVRVPCRNRGRRAGPVPASGSDSYISRHAPTGHTDRARHQRPALVPDEPHPTQVFLERERVLFVAAHGVRVFETQQERTAVPARQQPVEERSTDVAEMQPPGRARRKKRVLRGRLLI